MSGKRCPAVPKAQIDLVSSLQAPAQARRRVAELMLAWGHTGSLDTAMVLVTEIVSNAVRHAGGAPWLTVTAVDGCVRYAVHDDNPMHPQPRVPMATSEGGRGLLLVAALASAWGVQDEPTGKAVWFELRAEPGLRSGGQGGRSLTG